MEETEMKKRLVRSLLVALIVSSLLVGCGSQGVSESPSSPQASTAAAAEPSASTEAASTEAAATETPKPEPKKITLSHNQGEWIWPVMDEMGQEYTKATGNEVEYIYVPAEGYGTWVQAQLVAGSEPDIFWGGGVAADLFKNGQIIDLQQAYEEISPYTGKPWKEAFLPGLIEGLVDTNSGNAILGMPIALVTVNLYYNRSLFQELGLPDKAPQTYGELLQVCRQIKDKKPDVTPFAVMNGMPWNLSWMVGGFMEDLWVNSGIVEKLDIITPNGKLETPELVLGVKTGVIDPADPRMLDYFRYMKELSQYFNKGFNAMMWEYEKLFNEGQAAMQLNGSWYPNQHMLSAFPVEYGTGNVPYIDNSVSVYSQNRPMKRQLGGGADLLVTAKAQAEGRSDVAIDFLRFLSNPEFGAKIWVEKTMFLPVVKDVPVPEAMKGIVDGLGTDVEKTNMYQVFALTPEQDKAYQDMYKLFLEDGTTPEELVVKFKEITLKAADQYIEEKPEMKVQDFVDKVVK
jgi:raffinose/stachyose/melibiose transport system substrate-binding protein